MDRRNFIAGVTEFILFAGFSAAGFAQEPDEKKQKKYKVISKRCDGCGHCFRSCREKALLVTEKGKAYIEMEKCKGCGDCIRYCRRMAIVETDSQK